MPVRLTQEHLTLLPAFQPHHPRATLTAGKLPEGMVEFCFQAVELTPAGAVYIGLHTRRGSPAKSRPC